MAILTNIAGCDVVHGLTGGFGSVMATETIAHHAAMIKRGIRKIVGIVAGLALIAGLRVVDRFANRPYAIMARSTGFSDARVVESRDRPFSSRMAGLALSLRNDMISRFANRSDIVVATRTSLGCAGKDSAFVARVTRNFCMRARQWETGREVIELFFR